METATQTPTAASTAQKFEQALALEIKSLLDKLSKRIDDPKALSFGMSRKAEADHFFSPIKPLSARYDANGEEKKSSFLLWDRNSNDSYVQELIARFEKLVVLLYKYGKPITVPTEIDSGKEIIVRDMEYLAYFDFREKSPCLMRRFPLTPADNLDKLSSVLDGLLKQAAFPKDDVFETESLLTGNLNVN